MQKTLALCEFQLLNQRGLSGAAQRIRKRVFEYMQNDLIRRGVKHSFFKYIFMLCKLYYQITFKLSHSSRYSQRFLLDHLLRMNKRSTRVSSMVFVKINSNENETVLNFKFFVMYMFRMCTFTTTNLSLYSKCMFWITLDQKNIQVKRRPFHAYYSVLKCSLKSSNERLVLWIMLTNFF